MGVGQLRATGFPWWEDALEHARWLSTREGRRYRVYSRRGRWLVRPAVLGGGSVTSGRVRLEVECDACQTTETVDAATLPEAAAQVAAAGWLRNEPRDQDLCPDCLIPKVGLNVPSMLL